MTTTKTPASIERRLLNYTLAAAYLGISKRQVQEMAANGEFVKVPIGHRILLDRADLDDYIERVKRGA